MATASAATTVRGNPNGSYKTKSNRKSNNINSNNDDELTCGVCFHDFEFARLSGKSDRRPALSAACGHTVCYHCVQETWIKLEGYDGECPFCRQANAFPQSPRVNYLMIKLLRLHLQHEEEKKILTTAATNNKDAAVQTDGWSLCKNERKMAAVAVASNQNNQKMSPAAVSTKPKDPPGSFPRFVASSTNTESTTPALSPSTYASAPAYPFSATFQLGPVSPSQQSNKNRRHATYTFTRCKNRHQSNSRAVKTNYNASGISATAMAVTSNCPPNSVPENSNELFRLISERLWDDATKRAQDYAEEVRCLLSARGRQVTSLHAAIFFGAPPSLVRVLVEKFPSALTTRAWFADEGENLYPVGWAMKLGRLDIIAMLNPSSLSDVVARASVNASSTATAFTTTASSLSDAETPPTAALNSTHVLEEIPAISSTSVATSENFVSSIPEELSLEGAVSVNRVEEEGDNNAVSPPRASSTLLYSFASAIASKFSGSVSPSSSSPA